MYAMYVMYVNINLVSKTNKKRNERRNFRMITISEKELTERLAAAYESGINDGIAEGYEDGSLETLKEIADLLALEGIAMPAF